MTLTAKENLYRSRTPDQIGLLGATGIFSVEDVEYRFSVEINGMIYVGSYWPRWRWSYAPADLVVNDPIDVRIDGEHMYIKRSNGKELKTKVVQRIRKSNQEAAPSK